MYHSPSYLSWFRLCTFTSLDCLTQVADTINKLGLGSGSRKLIFVGHSMGGKCVLRVMVNTTDLECPSVATCLKPTRSNQIKSKKWKLPTKRCACLSLGTRS